LRSALTARAGPRVHPTITTIVTWTLTGFTQSCGLQQKIVRMHELDARLAWRLFHLNWVPIAAMGGILLAAFARGDFSIAPAAFLAMTGIALELALIAHLYVRLRQDTADPKLVFALGGIAQLFMIAIIMGPLSYVAGATSWPLQDQTFLAIDRALGMDPGVIAHFVNDRPSLLNLLETGYGLIKWFLLATPVILAVTLRPVRLQVFVLAFGLALAVTLAISALVPAIGTYYGLGLPLSDFPALNMMFYEAQLHDILALREGSLRHLELFELAGIVSFPSFHAASAVLYLWALWPVRGIGLAAAVLNVLMIIATPVIGAHYMIDVIGGVVLAVVSIRIAKYCRDLAAHEALPPAPASAPVFPQLKKS
jgi:membrane-associated phospholipid phosphatase